MEFSVKPRVGRPRTAKPIDEVETIPVTSEMKVKIRTWKNKGLELNEMTREFFSEVLRRAEAGQIEGLDSEKSAS